MLSMGENFLPNHGGKELGFLEEFGLEECQ